MHVIGCVASVLCVNTHALLGFRLVFLSVGDELKVKVEELEEAAATSQAVLDARVAEVEGATAAAQQLVQAERDAAIQQVEQMKVTSEATRSQLEESLAMIQDKATTVASLQAEIAQLRQDAGQSDALTSKIVALEAKVQTSEARVLTLEQEAAQHSEGSSANADMVSQLEAKIKEVCTANEAFVAANVGKDQQIAQLEEQVAGTISVSDACSHVGQAIPPILEELGDMIEKDHEYEGDTILEAVEDLVKKRTGVLLALLQGQEVPDDDDDDDDDDDEANDDD